MTDKIYLNAIKCWEVDNQFYFYQITFDLFFDSLF